MILHFLAMEAAGSGHSVVETIEPAIVLLGLGLVAALASKALRLSPIVGYLALGVILAALGVADQFEGPVVAALAEAGVMFLLFNLGLHFSLNRIRSEAGNIFGFGSLQMLIAGGGFTALCFLIGMPPIAAVIVGFALGLSSTAVVIGLIKERDQEDCPVGRAAQSILIFQDIAAIMLLVAAGALSVESAGGEGGILAALGIAAVKAVAAFVLAVLFARYLTDPLFTLLARTRSSEVYTAMALFIALAAGWATGVVGLSLTMGAFLGGVAVAESRYRILVQTEIEAFRGLFLGFFFISVGLSIEPGLMMENIAAIVGVAAALIFLKCAFNVLAALANKWTLPGSLQLGFLLGQGSEFALVLLSVPALAGMMGQALSAILVTAIALSLALTPLISNIGRAWAGKIRRGDADSKLAGDEAEIVILGLGEHGRAIADELRRASISYLAIEPNMERFELALADGYHVHHAMIGDPRGWDAMGLGKRKLIVVTLVRAERVFEISPLVRDRLPRMARIIAMEGSQHLDALRADGATALDVSRTGGDDLLAEAVFAQLGAERPQRHAPAKAQDADATIAA